MNTNQKYNIFYTFCDLCMAFLISYQYTCTTQSTTQFALF